MVTPVERQWHIIQRLETRRFDTMPHLAEELGVSYDTISRDIVHLSLVFPIWTAQGGNGGVYIADTFHLSHRHLTQKQRTTLEKIANALPREEQEIIQSILLDFSAV